MAQTLTIAVSALKDDPDADAMAFSQGQGFNLAAVDTHLGSHRTADTYFYRFVTSGFRESRKMLLVR